MPELVKVCNLDEIKEDRLKSVDVEGVKLMVTKFEGNYYVSSRMCTHSTFDLTEGPYSDGYVTCILHTSSFEIETGEATNPPAKDPLEMYKTVVQGNELFIEI